MSQLRPRSSAWGGSWRPPVPSMPSTKPVNRRMSSWPVTSIGDWGDLDDEDKSLNDAALIDGSRILSAYVTRKGERIWVITEAVNEVGLRYAHDRFETRGLLTHPSQPTDTPETSVR